MLRRLLDDLKQGVEGLHREHMHLVDDINALAHLGRGIDRVVAQAAHVIHAVVRRRIDLQHVHARAGIDAPAGRAAVARIAVDRVLAVDGLGQNFCAGRLARAARAGEQVGVAGLAGEDLVFQRLRDRKLTDHVVKGLRPVFSV